MHENNDVTELRRSSIISTYGPGSVIDFLADGVAVSGIATGLESWDEYFGPPGMDNNQRINETRLEKRLGVDGFRLPPILETRYNYSKPDTRRLLAVRFPKWLQCPKCEFIKPLRRWRSEPGKAYRYCASCTGKKKGNTNEYVVPVRFVMACKSGHVDEFPWDWWVGHEKECKSHKGENFEEHKGLVLRSEKPGLEGLILSCPECKARRSMDGVFSHSMWRHGPKCRGLRPWLADGTEKCSEEQQYVVQRGASNLYFAVTESALSIPPWSDRRLEILGDWWKILKGIEDFEDRVTHIKQAKAGGFDRVLMRLRMDEVELSRYIEETKSSHEKISIENLKYGEYRQFVSGGGFKSIDDREFETRSENVPEDLQAYLSKLVRAVRLREVRVLKGFTRINPPSDSNSNDFVTLAKEDLKWLPGIEMRGEGIFIELNIEKLREWENRIKVRNRVSKCDQLYQQDLIERYQTKFETYQSITPRFVLCHTLAHALMRQLTVECGYSAAELQERVYAQLGEVQMAGILIYTASADADGTLGGLERQGKAVRFSEILYNAIRSMEWCSSDPLCISDMMNAKESYSKSVCHACCMAPETACETFNRFLDRGLLIGDTECDGVGYFEGLIRNQ